MPRTHRVQIEQGCQLPHLVGACFGHGGGGSTVVAIVVVVAPSLADSRRNGHAKLSGDPVGRVFLGKDKVPLQVKRTAFPKAGNVGDAVSLPEVPPLSRRFAFAHGFAFVHANAVGAPPLPKVDLLVSRNGLHGGRGQQDPAGRVLHQIDVVGRTQGGSVQDVASQRPQAIGNRLARVANDEIQGHTVLVVVRIVFAVFIVSIRCGFVEAVPDRQLVRSIELVKGNDAQQW